MIVAALACALGLALVKSSAASPAADRRLVRFRHQRTTRPRGGRPSPLGRQRLVCGAACAGVIVIAGAVGGWPGLVVGGVLAPGLYRLVGRRAVGSPSTVAAEHDQVPLVFDLMAAALRAGAPIAVAVGCVAARAAPAVRAELERTAGLLTLGASPADAWRGAADHALLAPLAAVAIRSADSGIRLAAGLDRRASALREERRTSAIVRAQHVGVLSLLPLGFCFLPAFVCLGVIPIIAGVAGDAFAQISP